MGWAALWKLAKPFLPYLAGLCIVIAALAFSYHAGDSHGFHKRDPEVAALTLTIANMKAASAEATALNLQHVQEVETRQAKITKDATDALSKQLADARAATAAYVLQHGAKAAPRDAGAGGLSQVPRTAGATDGAPQEAIVAVSDIEACTDAYVIGTALQDWVRAVGK